MTTDQYGKTRSEVLAARLKNCISRELAQKVFFACSLVLPIEVMASGIESLEITTKTPAFQDQPLMEFFQLVGQRLAEGKVPTKEEIIALGSIKIEATPINEITTERYLFSRYALGPIDARNESYFGSFSITRVESEAYSPKYSILLSFNKSLNP